MPGANNPGKDLDDLLYDALPKNFVETTNQYKQALEPMYRYANLIYGKRFREYLMDIQYPRLSSVSDLIATNQIDLAHPCFDNLTAFLRKLVA